MSTGSIHRRPGFLLALGLCAIGGAVTLLGHLVVGPMAVPVRVPLADVAGDEACPSFSPNGRHLAYSGRGGEVPSGMRGAFHIWVRALPGGAPQQLTAGPGSDICPVWSPDGASLAFLRVAGDAAEYLIIPSGAPATPGTEKRVAEAEAPEDAPEHAALAWTRDGKSLLAVRTETGHSPSIFALSLENGAARRITNPPAGSAGDSGPALSPDGLTLAFVRGAGSEAGDIWLCDTSGGGLRQLTFDARPIRGVAWSADGRDVIYASNKARDTWNLWRTPAYGGSPREVLVGAKQVNDPAVAPSGRRLAFTETPSTSAIWLASLPVGDTLHTRPILRSAGREAYPSWSPDGKQIAFVSDQSGADEIWISDAAGGGCVQVTNLKGPALSRPRWSPDGRNLLFATRTMPESVYTAAVGARLARPQPLPLEFGAEVSGLTWSRDGKSVYAASRGLIYKLTHGQAPQQLTERLGAGHPAESPDGKYVYYWFRGSIWRVSANGGAEEEVVESSHWDSAIQPVSGGIYYMSRERRQRASIWFYDFATRKTSTVLDLNDEEVSRDASFDVSPDGRYLLYPKIDRTQTNLVLVENFR
jgi:Tol biopolymer transport system component